jgi:hypothetical protein
LFEANIEIRRRSFRYFLFLRFIPLIPYQDKCAPSLWHPSALPDHQRQWRQHTTIAVTYDCAKPASPCPGSPIATTGTAHFCCRRIDQSLIAAKGILPASPHMTHTRPHPEPAPSWTHTKSPSASLRMIRLRMGISQNLSPAP